MRARAAAVALLGALAAGCGRVDGGGGEWAGEMRDSAGVVVVTNRGPGLWPAGEGWSAVEDLVIRGEEDRPETLFGRVEDVGVDSRGRLYVLDAAASVVRVFDSGGATVGSFAGPGEGPGELSAFANGVLLLPGDTVLVPDWGQTRISRFLPDGTVLESVSIPGPGGRTWWTLAPDGRLLGRRLERIRDEEGRWSGRDLLLEMEPDGSRLDTLLAFDYPHSDLGAPGALKVPLLINAPSWAPLSDGRVAWASLDRARVRIEHPDSGLLRLVSRDDWVVRPATSGEHRRLIELLGVRFAMLGADSALVDGLTYLEEETIPAVTGVRAGPEGTLWVQRMGGLDTVHPFALNSPDRPEWLGSGIWDVFDEEGRYLGPLELPSGFRVMRVTGEAVYGVRPDELDAEEVVRFRLVRSGTAGG